MVAIRSDEFSGSSVDSGVVEAESENYYVEQAKGMLMKQRNLDEDEAYGLLSNMADKKNMKLTELATQLIEAAKKLIV